MAKSKKVWLGPDGRIMDKGAWQQLKNEHPAAWQIKMYEDDRIWTELRAFEYIYDDGTVPSEHWMRFCVNTSNLLRDDFMGNPLGAAVRVHDPAASGNYRTLKEAATAYQKFLAKYTACGFDKESGEFIESGNKLSPDIPKQPTSSKANDSFGSW